MLRHVLLSSVLVATLTPAIGVAETDWFASLYTGEGTELRADERVFALYAVLNAAGYDDAPVARQFPVPKHQFHPVRQQVRNALAAQSGDIRQQADAFFDAHPVPLQRYLTYALHSGPPASNVGPKSKELSDLKGLEGLLKAAYTQWGLDELQAKWQAEYRKVLRGYLTAVDAPMAKARKLLRVGDAGPSVTLVANLLQEQNEVLGVMGDGEVVVLVGPSDKPNVEGSVRAFGRVMMEPVVAKKAQSQWSGGAALLREAQVMGATEKSVADYATALFSRALALKASDASDAAYEAAAQKGYFGLKDIAQKFEEARPLDSWALEALAKVETRRPARR